MMKTALVSLALLIFTNSALAQSSICYGSTSQGRLENGVKLPASGKNFVSYSTLGEILGRTYLHSAVNDIVLGAYAELADLRPSSVYKYAETGFKNGGKFAPHKTHRNGLSVDFMVPVLNKEGDSVHLPTHLINKFGYKIEFNENGVYKSFRIDYEAMAAHIWALHQQATQTGYDVWRVIFAPELQKNLFSTSYGTYLKENIQFSKKRSWVRHDEHYHVDFDIPCK